MKTLASNFRLRRIIKDVLDYTKDTLFNIVNIFRPKFGDRNKVRIQGKEAIYDIFSWKEKRYIAVIGYYGRLGNPEDMVCIFESGEISKSIWINDFPEEHEGEQVMICLFEVPEPDRHIGTTSVALRLGNNLVFNNLPIRFTDHNKKHYFTVAAIMKDEGRFLEEWIEYYRVLGAEHFYIYDNKSWSRGKIRTLLKPYIEQGIVTLLDWDYSFTRRDNIRRTSQRGQIHHCLYKYGQISTWMLFIDRDEFVYPMDQDQTSLLPLLKEYERDPEVAALQFKMIWFGNSGYNEVPEGLVIENYTHRADDVIQRGREKVCVKPDKVELLYNHDVKQCVEGTVKIVIPPEQYRLNHYYATSRERYRRLGNQFNEQEDISMQRFVPLVRQCMRDH